PSPMPEVEPVTRAVFPMNMMTSPRFAPSRRKGRRHGARLGTPGSAGKWHQFMARSAPVITARVSFRRGIRLACMELYQIRYFLAVAETLNFTRASERSFVSQPALTKAIQRLEETIGGRLFDRTKNSVQLTILGTAMLPNFRQIYDAALQAREQARRLTRERKETVRVGEMW